MTSLPSSCSPNKSACGLIWTGERCIQMFQPFIFVKLEKIVLYDAFHVGWKTWIQAWRRRCLWARESLRKPWEREPCLGRLLFPLFEFCAHWLIDHCWRLPCLTWLILISQLEEARRLAFVWLLSSNLTFAWWELQIIALFLSGSWPTQAGAEERTW